MDDSKITLTPPAQLVLRPMNAPVDHRAASSSPSLVEQYLRFLEEPELFSVLSRRADLVLVYPELDPVCEHFGLDWEQTIAEHSPAPTGMLCALARTARPPPIAHHTDWS